MDNEGGYFIRVRVLIDVTLPLCRGRVITMENGEKNWVSFKYEQLPNFCFWCGHLTHSDKNCDLWLDSKGPLLLEQQQFSSSLKAAPYTSVGKLVIYVLGFYEGRKSGTHKSQEARAQLELVVAAPANGPSEVIQSNMEIETSEEVGEGIKVGDLATAETNKLENMLPQDIDSFPNKDSISNGSSPNLSPINSVVHSKAKTSFPTSATSAELFDIQIREINEDMNTYGQNTGVQVKPISTISENIKQRFQSESLLEGGKSHKGSKVFRLGPFIDRKRERFKVFEVEPRSNWGRTVMTS